MIVDMDSVTTKSVYHQIPCSLDSLQDAWLINPGEMIVPTIRHLRKFVDLRLQVAPQREKHLVATLDHWKAPCS